MQKKKNLVMLPDELFYRHYTGVLTGKYFSESNVFNVFSDTYINNYDLETLGIIFPERPKVFDQKLLIGWWEKDKLSFTYQNEIFEYKIHSLLQNIFSRNTGILESDVLNEKCALIIGCGSVGSLVALELARSGVGKFVLIDNDILEYHNICRHQCSILEVGQFKSIALKKRILDINPRAIVEAVISSIETVKKELFDNYCQKGNSILIGCADNRAADVYGNSLAVIYKIPFLSIGFWERAFAGEIFYYIPGRNMPCYKCALGDGISISQRVSANRRFYTNEEDLKAVNFEPGISVDINFVTNIGIKLLLDIFNIDNKNFTQRLLPHLKQYTLVCNTNERSIGGEMAEIFSYPLQVTTSLEVRFNDHCPPCEYE